MFVVILGYKYYSELDAQISNSLINKTLGIPVSPEATTRTWTNYQYDSLGFWYIIADDTIESILGQPTEFDITIIE